MYRLQKKTFRVRTAVLAIFLTLIAHYTVQAAEVSIQNFGSVSQNYYRGAQPEGHDYADLAKMGIHTIINLTSDDAKADEKLMTEGAGMKYFQIPMTTHKIPTPSQIAEFLKIVNDPQNQPVYVHCVGGKHRTGVMTAIYRMSSGWSADQAYEEMKKYKFGAAVLHSEFKNFVFDFYKGTTTTLETASVPVTAAVH